MFATILLLNDGTVRFADGDAITNRLTFARKFRDEASAAKSASEWKGKSDIADAWVIPVPSKGLPRVLISSMDFIRAGSDYVPGKWTANVRDDGRLSKGKEYFFERADGSGYKVRAVKRQTMDGVKTVHVEEVQ